MKLEIRASNILEFDTYRIQSVPCPNYKDQPIIMFKEITEFILRIIQNPKMFSGVKCNDFCPNASPLKKLIITLFYAIMIRDSPRYNAGVGEQL